MIYLSIWIENEISDFRLWCLNETRKLFTEKDSHLFISDCSIEGFETCPYKRIVEEIKSDPIWKHYIESCSSKFLTISKTNFIRFYLATKHPDLFYLDTDVRLLEIPTFDVGKPYFAQYRNTTRNDINAFYVNNRCDFFKDFLELTSKSIMKKGTCFRLLKELRQEIDTIPTKIYEHKNLEKYTQKFVR